MNALAPEYLLNGLIDRGIPAHIAQGFVMNARDESGLRSSINEQAPIVPGSRGGYGLMQWTGPRRRQLEAYAAQRGVSVADPDMQMDFLLTELQGPEAAAWQRIQQAQTAGEAGAAVVNAFLRPSESHRARREAQYLGGRAPDAGSYSGGNPAPVNALAQMPQVDPVALMELAQRQRTTMPQEQQAAPPSYDYQMPVNALAELPQYDRTAYNLRRLTNGA